MYPSKKQLAQLKECRALWGKDNVRMTGVTDRDPNLYVRCISDTCVHRMTYAPDGTVIASSVEMRMLPIDQHHIKPRNAIDN